MEDMIQALLIECHKAIEESAADTAAALMDQSALQNLFYPPNAGLCESEMNALATIGESPELESALRKIIANAAAQPLFSLFACIDGVSDPSDFNGEWLGLRLSQQTDEDPPEMLHDNFLETYWHWRGFRNDPGWNLDTYQP